MHWYLRRQAGGGGILPKVERRVPWARGEGSMHWVSDRVEICTCTGGRGECTVHRTVHIREMGQGSREKRDLERNC